MSEMEPKVPTFTVTLTATLMSILGDAAEGGFLRITLCGFGQALPAIPGNGMMADAGIPQLVGPQAGTTPLSVVLPLNNIITPASTFYEIAVLDANRNVIQSNNYVFNTAGTIDLSQAPSMRASLLLPEPRVVPAFVTLTANLMSILGDTAEGGFLRITLCGFGQWLPAIPGTGMLADAGIPQLVGPQAGTTPISVVLPLNNVIAPPSTFYEVALLDANRNVIQSGNYLFNTAGTVDLSQAPPLFPLPPATPTKITLDQLQNATANGIVLGSGPDGAGHPYKELTGIVTFGCMFDGGGSTPTPPILRMIQCQHNCQIVGWSIIGDAAGSANVDVWFLAGTVPPATPSIPTSANKISASAPISLSGSQSAAGGAVAMATWAKTLTQWGVLAFNLSSISTCKWIAVQIQCIRT